MIPLNYWVPDKLYIMLRITDRLWSLIISELEQNGEYDDDMRETICNEMKKCKVKFEFWKITKWEYTSLLGPDKLKEAYFLKPDITDPNNQDIIVEEGLYQPSDITPYIHVLVYHVPEFVKIHKEFGL
ncbi:16283_t:CDS:2, partial [Gigaspora margarita]